MDEIAKFQNWAANFRMSDDGVSAYRALQILEQVRFEFALREEGFLERVTELILE